MSVRGIVPRRVSTFQKGLNMLGKTVSALVAAGVLFGAASAPALAASYTYADALSGANTQDYTSMLAVTQGTVISYTVKGWGEGTNDLRFRAQQKNSSGNWIDLVDRSFSMSGTGASRSISGSFTVQNYLASSTENIRFVLGRKALTSRMDWEVKITY